MHDLVAKPKPNPATFAHTIFCNGRREKTGFAPAREDTERSR
jgi:hypothetical protein